MSTRIPDTVLQAYLSAHWAMTPDAMRKCYAIITRQTGDLDAVARELGRPLDNTRSTTVRDGVAYIPVRGPMIRYAGSLRAVSGATSYEALAQDLETAVRDSTVRAIVLNLDSPGGELSGCLDLGEQIRQADEQKPVYALASGTCASAGYLLAAATRRITANPSAVVGSLGVCLSIEDRSRADAAAGIQHIEIVSSQTPRKNADPATEEGRAAYQRVVDDLADAFGAPIARYRNVRAETVLQDYGAGVVIVGAQALAAGLVDAIAYTEEFHAQLVTELSAATPPRARAARSIASAAAPTASLHQEPTMKYKKGAKVRAAAGATVVKAGTEGTVEEVRDGVGFYRVAFAGGVSAWCAEDQLTAAAKPKAADAEEEEEKDEPPAGAEGDGDEEEEEEPAGAEGDDDEEEEEDEEAPAARTADPARTERERVLGIQALAMAGEDELIEACVNDPKCTVAEAALKLRTAQAKRPGDRLAARRAADGGKPRAGVVITDRAKPGVTPRAARVIAAIGRVFPQAKQKA